MTTIESMHARATQTPGRFTARVVHFLGSRLALGIVVGLFTVQSAWIAVAARYSIYDEQYHVQVVEDYARRWTPLVHQDAADGPVGDITRFNSYLYHYLLSFPWRLSGGLGDVQRLVLLRLITVAMVAVGLLVWVRVFRALGASAAVANVSLLLVSASPLLVDLAATVNYDNLLFLVSAGFVLVAVRLFRQPGDDLNSWLALVVLAGLGVLTKYTFVPFVIGVVLVLAVQRAVRAWRRRGRDGAPRVGTVRRQLSGLVSRPAGWALLVVTLVVVVAVFERYGGNVLRYGTPFPDCGQIQPVGVCRQWAPWARDDALDAAFPDGATSLKGMLGYGIGIWVPLMLRYATLIGVVRADGAVASGNGPNIVGVVTVVAFVAIATTIVLALPHLRRRSGFVPVAAGGAVYVAALFVTDYSAFRTEGQPVAVATRYVLFVLPVIVCAACLATSRLVGRHPAWKVTLVVVTIVSLTQGGGLLTFAYRADDTWVWDDPAVVRVERVLSDVAKSVVISDVLVPDPRPAPVHG